jgi:CubicO group peptidase (beta-lactamase class C family)
MGFDKMGKQIIRILPIIIVFLLLGCNKRSPIQSEITTEQYEILKEYTDSFPEETQLSIAVLNDSGTNYFGILLSGDSLVKINNRNSVFEIGSISKVFTSTILASFLLKETVRLDDPVEQFLPFELKREDSEDYKITFRTLANHTSGLPRMPDNFAFYPESSHDSRAYSNTALQEYLENDLSYISVPGKDYNYSNLGYGVLGYIISQISDKNYEFLLKKIICNPYKLKSTTTEIEKIRHRLVAGKDKEGNTIENYDLGVLNPSGGIFSNISDLRNLINANFRKDTLLSYQRQETYGWGNFGVALGWHIYKVGGNNCRWYYHNGGMEGYRSALYMDIETKKAVIILSNLSTFHPKSDNIDRLAERLLKNEYMIDNANETCIAPFVELALQKGWGGAKRDSLKSIEFPENTIYGVWKKVNDNRNNIRTFFPDNKVQTNFFGDSEIDVWGFYSIDGNEIEFADIGGAACSTSGKYQYEIQNDTLRFFEMTDICEGRKLGLSGDWIKVHGGG